MRSVLDNWNPSVQPHKICDQVYELIPDWRGCELYCFVINRDGDYVLHRGNDSESKCCIVNAESGLFTREECGWASKMPSWSTGVKSLCGYNFAGYCVKLIFGELTGINLMSCDNATSTNPYLIFTNRKVMESAIEYCQAEWGFEDFPMNENDQYQLCCTNSFLVDRCERWGEGEWVTLQAQGVNSNLEGLEGFTIITTLSDFKREFPLFTLPDLQCQHCHKSFKYFDLLHCADCGFRKPHYSCPNCVSSDHGHQMRPVEPKFSDPILTAYRLCLQKRRQKREASLQECGEANMGRDPVRGRGRGGMSRGRGLGRDHCGMSHGRGRGRGGNGYTVRGGSMMRGGRDRQRAEPEIDFEPHTRGGRGQMTRWRGRGRGANHVTLLPKATNNYNWDF